MAIPFEKAGQKAWFHDLGHFAGFFHTYDRFQVAGVNDAPRKVHVFLPREYESVGEHYPVVYMNDGDTAFFPGGLANKSWWTAEVLSTLYGENAIRKLIVVAVCPLNRDREYTHEPVLYRPCCGLKDYAQYLSDYVKPFIDRNYRTLPQAQETTILGSSHGGLAAFYIGCCKPDSFKNVAALSPSFWVGLDTGLGVFASLANSSLIELTSKTLYDKTIRPRVWLDWGLVRDGGEHNWWIEKHATKRGREMRDLLLNQKFGYVQDRELFTYEDPIGDHTEESWHRRLPMVLKAFYGLRINE
ncbi:MAG: alpha/beta hydrolase [Aulosira sp. ZfuVER01]|nr:alpha/beta hydrolase-fold protein [Aulosira sp. ZfuVER01]MDZ8002811.1 alpha/beta hydrolase-fold protein [Aulosira sp. DedVER01a]MDZ8054371.1 alpha/beta hydrolase-fold protein [Aulosira sp. ZfuCHP01]